MTNFDERIDSIIDSVSREAEGTVDERLEHALKVIATYGQIGVGRQKAWVIDQITRALVGSSYPIFISSLRDGVEGYETFNWDEGLPPTGEK